jgi:hypothetical protein
VIEEDEMNTMIVERADGCAALEALNRKVISPIGSQHEFGMLLGEQIHKVAPLPAGSIYVGISLDDGAPVVMDITKSCRGSLLISGNRQSGAATTLLQAIAAGLGHVFEPDKAQFAVITSACYEWENWESLPSCNGIFPLDNLSIGKIIRQLATWMRHRDCRQSQLLFIDGADLLLGSDANVSVLLRNLLLFGPAQNIWPIVTVATEDLGHLEPWMDCFRRCLVHVPTDSRSMYDFEFAMQENSTWCRFSILG